MKINQESNTWTFIPALIITSLLLTSCQTTGFAEPPEMDPTALDGNKCGTSQYKAGTLNSISWTGSCRNGLMEGNGTFTGLLNGERLEYIGWMHKGKFWTAFKSIDTSEIERHPQAQLYYSNIKYECGYYNGERNGQKCKTFVNEKIAEEGYYLQGSLYEGVVQMTDGGTIEGKFVPNSTTITTAGKGVKDGVYKNSNGTPNKWFRNEVAYSSEATRTEAALAENRAAEKVTADQNALIEKVKKEDGEFLAGLATAGVKLAIENANERIKRKQQGGGSSKSIHNVTYTLDEARSTEGMRVYFFPDLGDCVSVSPTGKKIPLYIQKTATVNCGVDVEFIYREFCDSNYDCFRLPAMGTKNGLTDWGHDKPVTRKELQVCPSRAIMEKLVGEKCTGPSFEKTPKLGCSCVAYSEVGTGK